MFDTAKSAAIRKGLNMMLNGKYGEVQSLDLDTKTRRVDLKLLLNGETEAVDMAIGRYEIDNAVPEHPVVILHDITVSRKWMEELAKDNVEGKRNEIPAKLASVVKLIL